MEYSLMRLNNYAMVAKRRKASWVKVLHWIAAIPAGMAWPAIYGRKRWQEFRQMQRNALVLEEDFIP